MSAAPGKLEAFSYEDDNGGKHDFWLDFEPSVLNSPPCWYLSVWPTPQVVLGTSPYQARFDLLAPDTIQSSSLENNGNAWAKGVGLSEAVFEEVSRRVGKKIVSSRPWVAGAGEWRTPKAERMWKRFERDGRARYDDSSRRFHYIPREQP